MSETVAVGSLVVFFMLLAYISIAQCIKRYQMTFGHEASFTIILGLLISFCFAEVGDNAIIKAMKFNETMFFYVCLPPIVFSSGFNMQRADFFANIGNVMTFGVLTTFVCFFIFSSLTIWATN